MKRRGRYDYLGRINALEQAMNVETGQLPTILRTLYLDEYRASGEIADILRSRSGIKITDRTIQRWIKRLGITRPVGEAYRLAAKRGRIDWAWCRKPEYAKARRTQLSDKLRYQILKRDNYKCVLCGATAETDTLEIDHIIPITQQGKNEPDNLRVLCTACNVGKRIIEQEK